MLDLSPLTFDTLQWDAADADGKTALLDSWNALLDKHKNTAINGQYMVRIVLPLYSKHVELSSGVASLLQWRHNCQHVHVDADSIPHNRIDRMSDDEVSSSPAISRRSVNMKTRVCLLASTNYANVDST